ncbi:hypothetical protein HIM_07743 [Hirsutella minnesotensis 3608]|uniref:Uncharacterized protein n=1 Tax=Hirsutella minnesotensis 3608 TaxID=1043627 RepID=A0A0F8A417_9HYPO|nr:hypothetical protein HIM_07743 [Hirsutella minnesotensis 3608]
MTSHTLLRLLAGAPGLPGPYLQENLAAYRCLDRLKADRNEIILAVGGFVKRDFFKSRPSQLKDHVVALWQVDDCTVVLDCEMHLQPEGTAPKIRGGPTPGHCRYHCVNTSLGTYRLALRLYCDVLSVFSDIVLIFVADFEGMGQVISFLCFWMSYAKAKHFPKRSQIILIADEATTREGFDEFELLTTMLSHLRTTEPGTPYSAAGVRQIIRQCFSCVLVRRCSELGPYAWQREMIQTRHDSQLKHVPPARKGALLKTAIALHAARPCVEFDPILCSKASRDTDVNAISIIASALVMHAFTPEMPSNADG